MEASLSRGEADLSATQFQPNQGKSKKKGTQKHEGGPSRSRFKVLDELDQDTNSTEKVEALKQKIKSLPDPGKQGPNLPAHTKARRLKAQKGPQSSLGTLTLKQAKTIKAPPSDRAHSRLTNRAGDSLPGDSWRSHPPLERSLVARMIETPLIKNDDG